MRRIAPPLLAGLLAVCLAFGLAGPCAACSCVAPVSLAEAAARSPGLAVFVGRVVALDENGGMGGVATVQVEGRFRGPLLPAVIGARHGGGGDCSIGMAVGERRLFTARLDEGGTWYPVLCDPQGTLGTPEGDALLAEATRTFGPIQPVGGPPVAPSPGGPDLVVIAAAAAIVLVIGLVLVVGVTAVARRSRREAE